MSSRLPNLTAPVFLSKSDRSIGVAVSGLLLVSVLALVADIYGVFNMGAALALFALPAIVLAVAIARRARNANHEVFGKGYGSGSCWVLPRPPAMMPAAFSFREH